MAEKLTFLHTSDLHLGAPLRGLRALSEKWADRVSRAIPAAFDALIDLALERSVDFVVMAGDIFDQSKASYAAYLRFASGLQRLDKAGIPVYMCAGNHDPYTSWRKDLADLPASTFMFPADKPGFTVFKRNGQALALLGGRSFYHQVFDASENIAAGITRAAAEEACGTAAPFAVGVLHTGLNIDPYKAPVQPANLMRAGMDYWALGHIHKPWCDDADDVHIAFSGCIQGRDIRETGPHGCSIVTLEEGKPNRFEFVPLASIVWQQLDVDISACQTVSAVQALVMNELFKANSTAQCDQMVSRVSLMGCTNLHHVLQEPGILNDLRDQINASHPAFFCDSLRDKTRAPWDRSALETEGLFPAALLGCARKLQAKEDETLSYLQQEFLNRNVVLPQALLAHLDSLQEDALETALDVLRCEVH